MARYKVMTTDDDQLRQVEEFLAAEKAVVAGSSRRLRFVATGNLTPAQQRHIVHLGARVVKDSVYDLE
jgi:hypothetical protein